MPVQVSAPEIAQYLDQSFIGSSAATVDSVRHVSGAGPGDLSWVGPSNYEVKNWEGSILIAPLEVEVECFPSTHPWAMFCVVDPRLAFCRIARQFLHTLITPTKAIIDPSAKIHPSAVIGTPGQGYVWDPNIKQYLAMPHFAHVQIGENVEVGPTATIMRGVLYDTVVAEGAKIGNGANIGHGAYIGKHCIVCAHASIAGSARIDDHVIVWQGATVKHSVHVGEKAVIGMGAVVIDDVPPGVTVAGNPARPIV